MVLLNRTIIQIRSLLTLHSRDGLKQEIIVIKNVERCSVSDLENVSQSSLDNLYLTSKPLKGLLWYSRM